MATGERGERTVLVREVRPVQSRSGNTRFVLTADDGDRYSTFREEIGQRAMRYIGRPAKIAFHRTRRGDFENVYLDSIEEPDDASPASGRGAATGAGSSEEEEQSTDEEESEPTSATARASGSKTRMRRRPAAP